MNEPYQPTPEEQALLDNYGFTRVAVDSNDDRYLRNLRNIWHFHDRGGPVLMAPGYWNWNENEWNLADSTGDIDWYDANLAALLTRAALEGLLT